MGKVPPLTREQEVAICKRMESAEKEQKRIIYGFGFTAKEHIAEAEKRFPNRRRNGFDRLIVDKKVEGRERHLLALGRLIKKVRALDQKVDEKACVLAGGSGASSKAKEKQFNEFELARVFETRKKPSPSFFTSRRSSRKW